MLNAYVTYTKTFGNMHKDACNRNSPQKKLTCHSLQRWEQLLRSIFVKCPGFPEDLCENYSFTKFELRV